MKNNNWAVIVLVVILIWLLFFSNQKYEGMTAEEWFNEYDYCEARLEEYRYALEEANDNIREANKMINFSKIWAWESYEDMGIALDLLKTVKIVPEP